MIDPIFKYLFLITLATVFLISCTAEGQPDHTKSPNSVQQEKQLLVFSKTNGWRHESIEAGQQAITLLGEQNDVGVTLTENSSMFHPDTLASYSAVIFLNTTETILNDDQRAAFENYIQNGGGFVGIHAAADTEYDWPWYGELVGAYFDNHPPGTPNADVLLQDSSHPATTMLPEIWNKDDEWYNYQGFSDQINVLLTLDTQSYEGSNHPGNHPIAWYHEFDGGRSFYTGLGHTKASYKDDLFLQHLWGGITYAISEQ
jgi:type 1 glutamine amidotransferase